MIKANDKLPTQGRVFIDYDRKKISFDYPIKRTKFSALFDGVYLQTRGYCLIGAMLLWSVFFIGDEERTVLRLFLPLFLFFVLPVILTFIYSRSKKVAELWAKLQTAGQTRYEMVFKNISSTKATVPIFKNILLHYKGYKDYSNIKSIRIKELPMKKLVKNKKKITREPQEIYWSAIFEFRKIPKEGKLIVELI